MEKKAKPGAVAWRLPGGGIYTARTARAAGLDGTQLELGSYEAGYLSAQREVMEGHSEDKERYGIEYPALVLNDVMINEFIDGRDTEHGRIVYDQTALGTETAKRMGIDRIMIPNFVENLITCRRYVEHTREALSHACRLVAPEGILILTENALGWKEQEELLRGIGVDNLKVHFDTQNFKLNFDMDQCEQLEYLYLLMGSMLHTKDGEAGPSDRPLGRGNTDFGGQVRFLKGHEFEGWIVTENYYNLSPPRKLVLEGRQMELLRRDMEPISEWFVRPGKQKDNNRYNSAGCLLHHA